jgi:RNA polymerase sigma factor (sigma-70 family)
LAFNAARARRADPAGLASPLSVVDEPVAPEPNPYESARGNEWMERLRREVDGLSHYLRVLFGLRYEDHLTIGEIASATESTETAVKVALHRARKMLRERLREFGEAT